MYKKMSVVGTNYKIFNYIYILIMLSIYKYKVNDNKQK